MILRWCWSVLGAMGDGQSQLGPIDEDESTFAPLVVLVINVNIHGVGLILLCSIFQISSTMA